MGSLLRMSFSDGDFGGLSDEIMLIILNQLSSRDLFSIMRSCRRLNNLCQERNLWCSIEDPPDREQVLRFAVTNLLNSKTKRVRLKGETLNRGYRSSLPPSVAHKLFKSGDHLTELQLIDQHLDSNYFRLHYLPINLKILNMQGCVVYNLNEHEPYLKDLCLTLLNLEELNLSYCSFVTAHSLMAISKLPKLEKLFLTGCRKIGECLAYVALSSRFGFQKLKILNVTNTKVGSSEFTSFAGIQSLEEFYCGQYDAFVDHNCNYITDLCITRIRNSKTLKVLDISGSRLTDRAFEVLETIPNLRHVQAHFTSLTNAGIARFNINRPNCRIEKTSNPVNVPVPTSPGHQDIEVQAGNGIIYSLSLHPNHIA